MNFLNDLTVWKLSKTAPNALKHHINAKEYAIRWPTDLAFVPLVIHILINNHRVRMHDQLAICSRDLNAKLRRGCTF